MKKKAMLLVLILISINSAMAQTSSINQNGLQSTVTNNLGANGTQAKRYEIASVLYNSHHWQNSSVIEVELYNVYYSSGYEKFVIELGFGQGTTGNPKIIHVDSKGIVRDAKVVLGTPVNHTTSNGGHVNKVLPIYVDVRHYGIYKAKIKHLKKKVNAFTGAGEIIINESPSGTNISDFIPIAFTQITRKNGVVGIGTERPGEGISKLADLKLEVNGSLTVTAGKKITLDKDYYSHGYLEYNDAVPQARFLRYGYYGHRFADNGGIRMVIQQGGNVGIGTDTPKQKLDVNGVIEAGGTSTLGGVFLAQQYGENNYISTLSSNYSSGALILGYGAAGMKSKGSTGQLVSTFDNFSSHRGALRINKGSLEFLSTPSAVQTAVNSELNVESRFFINNTGNVGIGTNTPDSKLAVNGTIHAKEVKVDLTGWPDYVFTTNYKLPTLEEVEKHIKEKGHLVNIPSAKEVEKDGVELGEMNKKLLEKIEELTLYTIQQEKKIKKQEVKLKRQERKLKKEEERNKKLEERLSKIETFLKKIK